MVSRERGVIPIGLILYALAAVAVIGGIWAFHNHGVRQGRAEVQARWDAAIEEQREQESKAIEKASTKLEASNVKARVVTKQVIVEREKIIDRPIYSNVCLDSDGLRLARCAIAGENPATCKPDGPVRSAATVDGRDWRIRLALDYGRRLAIP